MTKMSFPLKRDITASLCSGLAFPLKPAIELARNLLLSTDTFRARAFDTKYTQVNLMDLLTDWQVVIQSVFSVSQKREFE